STDKGVESIPSSIRGTLRMFAKDPTIKGFVSISGDHEFFYDVFTQTGQASEHPIPLGVLQVILRYNSSGARWIDMKGKSLEEVENAHRQAISEDPRLQWRALYRITD